MPNPLPSILVAGGLVSFVGIALFLLRAENVRGKSRRRLRSVGSVAVGPTAASSDVDRLVPRYRVRPWVITLIIGLACWLLGMPLLFAAAVTVIVGLLLFQLEQTRAERRTATVEAQLAEAIDLMVGALHAGASAVVALRRAADESPDPLRQLLKDGLARIRYGDDPSAVMRRTEERIPTETFRLFTTTMSVHWEVGGSLAPTLAVVGRVVRDRIEVARRVRSLTAQARFSTVMLLVTTYFIALLMWRQNPGRVRLFLSTPIGSAAVAGSMVLQAVGIVWQAMASRVNY